MVPHGADETRHDAASTVEWHRIDATAVPAPLVRRVPYVEVKLEHPTLEPTGLGDQFFPDAVPCELDGSQRIFYWRGSLAESTDPGERWVAVSATTDALAGVSSLPARIGGLTTEPWTGVTLVVDGTVGGDTTTARVHSYDTPSVELAAVGDAEIELRVDGTLERVAAGERRRISLDERTVESLDGDDGPHSVTPELAVRYPGRREVHHPASGASYRLFPSFGIDLDDLSRRIDVPTAAGELDDGALADVLGVDLATRPYAERVLWQAFAYTAFDPHGGTVPALAQLRTGHIVSLTRGSEAGQRSE